MNYHILEKHKNPRIIGALRKEGGFEPVVFKAIGEKGSFTPISYNRLNDSERKNFNDMVKKIGSSNQ